MIADSNTADPMTILRARLAGLEESFKRSVDHHELVGDRHPELRNLFGKQQERLVEEIRSLQRTIKIVEAGKIEECVRPGCGGVAVGVPFEEAGLEHWSFLCATCAWEWSAPRGSTAEILIGLGAEFVRQVVELDEDLATDPSKVRPNWISGIPRCSLQDCPSYQIPDDPTDENQDPFCSASECVITDGLDERCRAIPESSYCSEEEKLRRKAEDTLEHIRRTRAGDWSTYEPRNTVDKRIEDRLPFNPREKEYVRARITDDSTMEVEFGTTIFDVSRADFDHVYQIVDEEGS